MGSLILKWNVPVDDKVWTIGGGPVVHIASQKGRIDEVQVWTQEVPGILKERKVQIFGTGHNLPEFAKPLGSVVVSDGNLVWHVVEVWHG